MLDWKLSLSILFQTSSIIHKNRKHVEQAKQEGGPVSGSRLLFWKVYVGAASLWAALKFGNQELKRLITEAIALSRASASATCSAESRPRLLLNAALAVL
jgi:hypothetical protein